MEYVDDNLLLRAAFTREGMMVILQERGRAVIENGQRVSGFGALTGALTGALDGAPCYALTISDSSDASV
eukprot:COSAG02_NODE_1814_length_10782_cov_383.824862_9_plen_70_part_00